MASDVSIANLALISIGADTIMSLDEDSKPARVINAIYDLVRDDVLREHAWNFAIRWAQLAQLDEDPDNGYTYAYQLPTDPKCLRVIRMSDEDDDFKVENGKLYTDESSCTIKYIARVTDPTQYDSAFVSAFAARLAAEIAYNLTGDKNLAKAKWEEYLAKIRAARGSDSQEGKPDYRDYSSWINARRGYYDDTVEFTTE